MKFNVKLLEQIGQTQSIHQNDSVKQMIQGMNIQEQAFHKIKSQNNDLICLLLPDDDDEE